MTTTTHPEPQKRIWATPLSRLKRSLLKRFMSARDVQEGILRESLKGQYRNKNAVIEGFFIAYGLLQPICYEYCLQRLATVAWELDRATRRLTYETGAYHDYPQITASETADEAASLLLHVALTDILASIKTGSYISSRPMPKTVQGFIVEQAPWLVPFNTELFDMAFIKRSHPTQLSAVMALHGLADDANSLRDLVVLKDQQSTYTPITITLPSDIL